MSFITIIFVGIFWLFLAGIAGLFGFGSIAMFKKVSKEKNNRRKIFFEVLGLHLRGWTGVVVPGLIAIGIAIYLFHSIHSSWSH